MIEKLTKFTDYFRKVPAAFLVAIISVLCLILFLADDIAETLAVDEFRSSYRKYLDPAFLLTVAFSIARIFIFFKDIYNRKKS